MDDSSSSVQYNTINNESSECIVGDIKVCVTEDDDIEAFLLAGIVKHELTEEKIEGDPGHDVAKGYRDIDIFEPNIIAKCERVKSEVNTDTVASSTSNSDEQVLLPKCSYQCTKDPGDTHTGVKQNILECDNISPKQSSDTSISKKHERSHSSKPECIICVKKFSSIASLKTHKRVHTGEKPYKCNICSKKFGDMSTLNRHKLIHTGEKPFECSLCMKKFGEVWSLKRHKQIHAGEKPYECDICEKKFMRGYTLDRHKLIHIGENLVEKKDCEKKFGEISYLKKKLKCNICMRKFNDDSSLRRHTRLHAGEKPFECNTCMKKFSDKSNLRVHTLIHTGEKPFKCNICMKHFRLSSRLKSHERIHSTEKPLNSTVD